MVTVNVEAIGLINRQLVLDLVQGNRSSSGFNIADFRHEQNYDYDLSYGQQHKTHPLGKNWVGEKYYCYKNLQQIDMQKRIVHVYNGTNRMGTQKFYRLIHTAAQPGLRDNSYDRIEEIVGIREALFQAEANALGAIDIDRKPPAVDKDALFRAAGKMAGNRLG